MPGRRITSAPRIAKRSSTQTRANTLLPKSRQQEQRRTRPNMAITNGLPHGSPGRGERKIHVSHPSRGAARHSGKLPEVRDGVRAKSRMEVRQSGAVRLSDAPGDGASRIIRAVARSAAWRSIEAIVLTYYQRCHGGVLRGSSATLPTNQRLGAIWPNEETTISSACESKAASTRQVAANPPSTAC
jgi:hypothetical protein